MGRSSKKEELLDTAEALFVRQGFVATGINQITQEAGVASMTLYNNFETKEALIIATLERRSARMVGEIVAKVDKAGDDPKQRILAVFDSVDAWIARELKKKHGFGGCTFIKASIEYGSLKHEIHKVAMRHKRELIDLFAENAALAGYPDPEAMGLQLHLLIDGAISQAQVFADAGSAKRAKAMAEKIL